jgi:hypothetical protein
LIITISGFITLFRYANFFSFLTDKIHDLIINVNSARAGGARMSDTFGLLNHLMGFFVFVLSLNCVRPRFFFPIFVAMALAERKGKRAFFILLIVLGVGVFPFIGSRSSLLGIAISLLNFCFLYQKKNQAE